MQANAGSGADLVVNEIGNYEGTVVLSSAASQPSVAAGHCRRQVDNDAALSQAGRADG